MQSLRKTQRLIPRIAFAAMFAASCLRAQAPSDPPAVLAAAPSPAPPNGQQIASVSLLEAPAALPDAPSAQSSSSASSAPDSSATAPTTPPPHTHPQQTQRILGIMPNFRSVSADERLPPQSVKDKFVAAGHDSFDYSSFVIAAIQTSISFASDSYPEFHHGAVGFGRYYWHTLADTGDENFLVGGALPAVFHQDSRFYTLGHGTVGHRALYAATRILITRKDDGDRTFNFSEVIGAGAAAGISSTYYPAAYRDWTKVGQKWLTGMIIDSANFTFKEFWPNINNKVFHTK